jgi:hypothetical protein
MDISSNGLVAKNNTIKSPLSKADFIITGENSGLSRTCFTGESSGLLYDDTGTFQWVIS